MKWAHLPTNGGLYEQNPDLLDRFFFIFQERARHEAEKEQKRQREQGATTRQAGTRRPSRGSTSRRG